MLPQQVWLRVSSCYPSPNSVVAMDRSGLATAYRLGHAERYHSDRDQQKQKRWQLSFADSPRSILDQALSHL